MSLKVEHVTLQGNRVEVALLEGAKASPPPYFGIGVGNAESVLIRDNRLLGGEWPDSLHELNMGVHLHGEYGPRVLVRENHVTDFDIGVELKPTDAAEQKGVLWSVHGNVFRTRVMLVAPSWVKAASLEGDKNVQA